MYNEIKLNNRLYNITGKSFTKALAELDPDEEYEGTPLSGLDAYERQLKRFDTKVSGRDCDTVDKFFATSETAVLFPEFVKRQISHGIDKYFALNNTAASVITVDDTVYNSLSVTYPDNVNSVDEGAALPQIVVKCKQASYICKLGRELKLTYEVIRKRRLDTFAAILRQLGYSIAMCANNYAVTTIISGAGVTKEVAAASFSYASLIEFWASLADFQMDTIICSPANFAKILQLSEIKNSSASGIDTENSVITLPFGLKIMAVQGYTGEDMLGIAKDFAYELAVCGDLTVDIDKLISTQYDQVGASMSVGVSSLNGKAIAKLTIKKA